MNPSRTLLATTVLAAIFVAGLFVPPLIPSADGGGLGQALRGLYAPLCHQQPERSFHLFGAPVALCARCTGSYLGGCAGLFLAATGLARLRRGKMAWLVVASLPSMIDIGARLAGSPGVDGLARAAFAMPAGVVAGLLLADGIEDAVRVLEERRSARTARTIPERTCRPAWIAAAGERKP